MIETSSGLILRTRPLTESSLIVQWLTPDFGRLATVAKGARRAKSTLRGKLDLFYEADFSFVRSRRSELHTLREVNLRESHLALRKELAYLEQASYASVLIEQNTETETPLPELYELISGFLASLPKSVPQSQTLFALELKLLQELGMNPDLESVRLTPGVKEIIRVLLDASWETISRLRLSAPQRNELNHFLQGFLIFHLGRLPKGREAALKY
jgi:DNA repair protein RecO